MQEDEAAAQAGRVEFFFWSSGDFFRTKTTELGFG